MADERIRDLQEEIHALRERVAYLELEMETRLEQDIQILNKATQTPFRRYTSDTKPSRKYIVGYKVIKVPNENMKQFEDIVLYWLGQGWILYEGLCISDSYLCQALVKYSALSKTVR